MPSSKVPRVLSFDELAGRYNYPVNNRHAFMGALIHELERLPRPRRVLDAGAGRGIARSVDYQRMVRERVDEYWGIEPDPNVAREDGLFHHFQHATMESANLPEESFDLVYSFMVMEHVAEPALFLKSVHRCLRPGGIHLFVTVNGRSFFAISAFLANRLKIDELALRMLKPENGPGHHYGLQYRCNRVPIIDAHAADAGFEPPRYAYVEESGVRSYLPGVLRPLYHAIALKRRLIKHPESLSSLICRMRKRVHES